MKVLLICPLSHSKVGLQAFIFVEPLGLEAIAASLTSEHKVEILDARLEPDIRRKLSSFRPDAVGVTASFTSTVYSVYEVLKAVRAYNSKIHTFVGGYPATLRHSDFAGWVDAVVLGEGELTALELLRCWEQGTPLDGIQGIAFQDSGGWTETEPRPLIENLDQTPLPARHLVAKYQNHYFQGSWRPCTQVETSRGCPQRCKFCAVWKFHRGRARMRSPQSVVQELSEITSPYIAFADDNFLTSPSRAREICQAIHEAGIDKNYQIQARSDTIVKHPDLLLEWAAIGLKTVFIGFESFTQEGLEALGKRTSLQNNEEAIHILKELGIGIVSSFIVDPDFSEQDFADLENYIQQKKPPLPVFWVLTPIPGTILHQERHRELISENYDLFDGLHAVLPTRLGLKKFYQQYFNLYRSIYLKRLLPVLVARKVSGVSPFTFLKKLVTMLWLLKDFNPRSLWKHHFQPPRRPFS